MEPFSIHCTTCRSKLKVRDESAIGQILNCPKCGSMIEVVAPKDRPHGTQSDSKTSDSSAATDTSSKPKTKSSWSLTPPDFNDMPADAGGDFQKQLPDTASHSYSSIIQKTKSPVSDATPEDGDRSEGVDRTQAPGQGGKPFSTSSSNQSLSRSDKTPSAHDAGHSPADAANQKETERDDDASPVPPNLDWAVQGERVWQRRITISLAVLAVAILVGIVISQSAPQPPSEIEPAPKVAENADEPPPTTTDDPTLLADESERASFDSPWVPNEAQIAAGNRTNDERRTRLLAGLIDYADLEDGFPQGAGGAVQLAPRTRLSWIATLLPYLDRGEWHRDLNFRRSWNDPRNQEVTRRPLDVVVNPLIQRTASDDGFPVTHYVGTGGVGPGAGTLPMDHPRAGVFGYNRRLRADRIGDGASQTIALLPVRESLGPWSSGGAATVRSLTAQPYVNGPDGFGDGKPDGMMVAMADGSVAFVSSEIDPDVLERLVTINGQEPVDLSILDQRPSPGDLVDDGEGPHEPAADHVADDAASNSETDPPNIEVRPEPVVYSEQAIAERLAHELDEVDFRGATLADFIHFLAQMTELTFAFDTDALAAAGVTPAAPVNVHLQNVDIKMALTTALMEHELVYEITDGLLLITRPRQRREPLTAVKHETAGLVGADDGQTEQLAQVIRTVVAPKTWRKAGGRGFVEVAKERLTIHQSEAVHHQVADLLTRLHDARRAADAGVDREPLLHDTRRGLTNAQLLTPVTAHFPEPTPLESILRYLGEQTDTHFAIDALALRQDGRVVRIESTLSVNRTSLAETLAQLCQAVDLTYRVRDDRWIEITTHSAAAERPELEFFFVGDLLRDGAQQEALIAEITGNVAPAKWGDEPGSGALYFDEPSGCLLVWQPQSIQLELERLLESKRDER